MIVASMFALGVAVERLVNGSSPGALEIVSQPAFASLPEEANAQGLDASLGERELDDGLWLAAFGDPIISEPAPEPEPAVLQDVLVEEEVVAAPEEPVETNEYWLTGLMTGDGDALALVHDGFEERVVRLGGGLSGGETVVEIEKDSILARRDGEIIRIGFQDEEENW